MSAITRPMDWVFRSTTATGNPPIERMKMAKINILKRPDNPRQEAARSCRFAAVKFVAMSDTKNSN